MIIHPNAFYSPVANGWNPARAGSGITVGGASNVDAVMAGGAGWQGVNGVTGIDAASANHYFEATLSGTTTFIMIGCSKNTVTLANAFARADTHLFYSAGQTYSNGGVAGSAPAWGGTYGGAGTDRIGVCLKNGKVYFRLNGAWINSSSPETEINAAMSGLSGTYYPMAVMYDITTMTIHVLSGTIVGSIPSGAAPWN